MGFFDVIKDQLIGTPNDFDLFPTTTLTPEQQRALRDLFGFFREEGSGGFKPPEFQGGFDIAQNPTSSLSLQGLSALASGQGGPTGGGGEGTTGTGLQAGAEQLLTTLMDFEGSRTGTEEFFQTNIQDPALKEFEETVLPSVGRSFGGANFFSSERREADALAREDLLDALTQSRSALEFQGAEAAKNRALEAAGISDQFARTRIGERDIRLQELLGSFGAGQETREFERGTRDREFAEFSRQQEERARRIAQIMAAIGVPGIENIGVAAPATRGELGRAFEGFMTGLGSSLGPGSSRAYKTDNEPITILDKLASVPVERWRYRWGEAYHIGPYAE
ncbi:MAG: hypothetical protein ACRD4B_03420, partial [Acidobacteriota bacterium]